MVRVDILGPLRLERDGEPVELSGGRLRALLTRLALDAGRPVDHERARRRRVGQRPSGRRAARAAVARVARCGAASATCWRRRPAATGSRSRRRPSTRRASSGWSPRAPARGAGALARPVGHPQLEEAARARAAGARRRDASPSSRPRSPSTRSTRSSPPATSPRSPPPAARPMRSRPTSRCGSASTRSSAPCRRPSWPRRTSPCSRRQVRAHEQPARAGDELRRPRRRRSAADRRAARDRAAGHARRPGRRRARRGSPARRSHAGWTVSTAASGWSSSRRSPPRSRSSPPRSPRSACARAPSLDRPGATLRDGLERLIDALVDRETILILDNCEHLIGAAASLADTLLGACPDLRIVATSREPLAIAGENLVPVTPLGDDPAVELFLDRARAASPGFALDAGGRGDLPPARRSAAGDRARRRAAADDARRADRRAPGRPLPAAHRRLARRAAAAPHAARGGRLELGAARRGRARAGAPARGLPGGRDRGVRRRRVRRRRRARRAHRARRALAGGGRRRATGCSRRSASTRWRSSRRRARSRPRAPPMRTGSPRSSTAPSRELRGSEQRDWFRRLQAEKDDVIAALRWLGDSGDARAALHLAVDLLWFWMLSGSPEEAMAWIAVRARRARRDRPDRPADRRGHHRDREA